MAMTSANSQIRYARSYLDDALPTLPSLQTSPIALKITSLAKCESWPFTRGYSLMRVLQFHADAKGNLLACLGSFASMFSSISVPPYRSKLTSFPIPSGVPLFNRGCKVLQGILLSPVPDATLIYQETRSRVGGWPTSHPITKSGAPVSLLRRGFPQPPDPAAQPSSPTQSRPSPPPRSHSDAHSTRPTPQPTSPDPVAPGSHGCSSASPTTSPSERH